MAGVPRLGVLWCPHWPVVVAGARPDEPVVVVHANRVVAHSLAAAAEGVTVGMRRRATQARSPHVRIEQYDPDRDARAFDQVVQAVAAEVPQLELTGRRVPRARRAEMWLPAADGRMCPLPDVVAPVPVDHVAGPVPLDQAG